MSISIDTAIVSNTHANLHDPPNPEFFILGAFGSRVVLDQFFAAWVNLEGRDAPHPKPAYEGTIDATSNGQLTRGRSMIASSRPGFSTAERRKVGFSELRPTRQEDPTWTGSLLLIRA
jgi:hypothetical protein